MERKTHDVHLTKGTNQEEAPLTPASAWESLCSIHPMRHVTCFSLLFGFVLITHAADWPGWRGPAGTAVSTEKDLPIHWGKHQNIAWKTSIPGKGASSPAVVGNRIY